jgi:hypothetical protein
MHANGFWTKIPKAVSAVKKQLSKQTTTKNQEKISAHIIFYPHQQKSEYLVHCVVVSFSIRDHPRFFDQVGHQTTNASIGNKHFFTK